MDKNVKVLMLMPGSILIIFFMILPLINSIIPTFSYEDSLSLKSYWDFFRDSYNLSIIIRTLRISLIVTLITVLLGIPTAYYISTVSKKIRRLLLALVLFPLLTNSVIRSFAWITILGKNGVINKWLLSVHLINEPVNLLYTEFAIIIGSVYLFLPTMITTLTGVFETIEPEMLEASETLGATTLQTFFKVIVPLAVPGAIVGSTLVFTGTFTAYTTPQLLGGNQKMMLATLLYQKASTLGDWHSVGIIGLTMIVITFIVMKLFDKLASLIDRRKVNHA